MQYRHRRLLLAVIFLLTAAVGVAPHAPAQTVTEFPIPTASSKPADITAGPDGALWFTENAGNQIGRITTAGVITDEFPIPTTNSQPLGITAGPDGALWFTEGAASKIGRITTAGVITNEFPIPTVDSKPEFITAGPDGALWFTEQSANKIGRITTAGVITNEFPIPTANSQPRGITTGRTARYGSLKAIPTKSAALRPRVCFPNFRSLLAPVAIPNSSRRGQTALCGSPNVSFNRMRA
jgi:virginiamycin B lyase